MYLPALISYKQTLAGVTLRRAEADDMVGITFKGPAFAGGEDVEITGTAKEIFEQLIEMNPNYEADTANTTLPEQVHRLPLKKRDDINCNPAGNEVGNWITQCSEGLGYLERLKGYCNAPKGWGGCARVSCSWNCGISLCNDNSFSIDVPCNWIAADAWDIIGECANDWGDLVSSVKGQKFRYTGLNAAYNVIVKSHSC